MSPAFKILHWYLKKDLSAAETQFPSLFLSPCNNRVLFETMSLLRSELFLPKALHGTYTPFNLNKLKKSVDRPKSTLSVWSPLNKASSDGLKATLKLFF